MFKGKNKTQKLQTVSKQFNITSCFFHLKQETVKRIIFYCCSPVSNYILGQDLWSCRSRVMGRTLTLELSGSQALLKPLHLVLEEADMPHHVLRRVYFHGNVSRGRRSRHGLVQLFLKDSNLARNKANARLLLLNLKIQDNLKALC